VLILQAAAGSAGTGGVFSQPSTQSLMQQMLQNPQLMQNMMQAPYVQQMMQMVGSNPDLAQQVDLAVVIVVFCDK
jgi:ubiquilin